MTFGHGDWIEGFGEIRGLYHRKECTVYICYDGTRYNYFKRPF